MNGKQIREITAESIFYIDELGVERTIDLNVCCETHLARKLHPDNLAKMKQINNMTEADLEAYIERCKRSKYVGDRSIIGDSWESRIPYMEFYTDPPIRFEFETEDNFREVRYTLEKLGWSTFDLS